METKRTSWNFPTSIQFGPGSISSLPSFCTEQKITRPLVITDTGLANATFVADIVHHQQAAGFHTNLYTQVQSNPVAENVDNAVSVFNGANHDGIIAVGGGSALDVAKAVALITCQDKPLWTLGGKTFDWSWINTQDIVPLIAVPTTAGTGSEVGRCSVITHEQTHSKKIIFHANLMPPLVVLDPELTCALPSHITAATGIDAFVHCFEAYCAPGYHPMAEGIALEGMRLIAKALPQAYANGNDIQARGRMLTAATMGATAFQKDLGAVHALAHPIGALYNIHHGLLNAVILPYVMVANKAAIAERMVLLGRILNVHNPGFDSVLDWVVDFRNRLGIAHSLQEVGVPSDNINKIAQRAECDSCAAGNPITFNAKQYAAIFTRALEGRL